MYQDLYKLPIYGAIFFNHESPRRSNEYVTQKIIQQACEILYKKRKKICLGDITARIDWGYAKDYVFYSWKIMQLKKENFFVIATGKTTSVENFLKLTFSKLNLDYAKFLSIDKNLLRPSKTSELTGDFSKAKKFLDYKVHTSVEKIIDIMLEEELKKYK